MASFRALCAIRSSILSLAAAIMPRMVTRSQLVPAPRLLKQYFLARSLMTEAEFLAVATTKYEQHTAEALHYFFVLPLRTNIAITAI